MLNFDFLLPNVRLIVTSSLKIFITFFLQRVRIDLKAFDGVNGWHILLIILLIVLLFSEHLYLEQLQPTLVSKDIRTELDHFAVDVIVGWNIGDQALIFRFNVSDHLQVKVNLIFQLIKVQRSSLNRRLFDMKVEPMLIPVPPRFLLPLNHEFVDVHEGLMSKPFQNVEFSLSFGISPNL